MSYLETKRNAIMNSVASSGAIELLETKTITEDTAIINFDVDTDTYKTFLIKGDFEFNQSSNNWIYLGINGSAGSGGNYIDKNIGQTETIPSTDNKLAFPIIYSKGVSGNAVSNFRQNFPGGFIYSEQWENVTQISLGVYGTSRYANGTTLELYGMKENLIF